MFSRNQSFCYSDVHDDVYERWLRRRLDYAVIRETGNHAAPGFVHTILHSGSGHNTVTSEVREEMWKNNKYPHANFFQHGQVLYGFPPYIKETLDLRFANSPRDRERCTLNPIHRTNTYDLSLKEMTTVPNWMGHLVINSCPYPHTLETPLTWTLGEKPAYKGIQPCPNPVVVNTPAYPECCYRHDNACSAVYCSDPMPETVNLPGPFGRGEAHFKWHLNHPEGKGKPTASNQINVVRKDTPKDAPCSKRCG
ncbi:hypothetical protein BsWGS_20475 [Bradybaena similaris]